MGEGEEIPDDAVRIRVIIVNLSSLPRILLPLLNQSNAAPNARLSYRGRTRLRTDQMGFDLK